MWCKRISVESDDAVLPPGIHLLQEHVVRDSGHPRKHETQRLQATGRRMTMAKAVAQVPRFFSVNTVLRFIMNLRFLRGAHRHSHAAAATLEAAALELLPASRPYRSAKTIAVVRNRR